MPPTSWVVIAPPVTATTQSDRWTLLPAPTGATPVPTSGRGYPRGIR